MSRKFPMRSLSIAGLIGAMYGISSDPMRLREYKTSKPRTEAEKAKLHGLKEWNIEGVTIYAASKKAALKKYLKATE